MKDVLAVFLFILFILPPSCIFDGVTVKRSMIENVARILDHAAESPSQFTPKEKP